MAGATDSLVLHATSVAWQGRAILISGDSGLGKSSLAIDLVSRGCTLVSDDRTLVQADADGLTATAPVPIRGAIEMRGMGLLKAPASPSARPIAMIDLSRTETERLPKLRQTILLGHSLRLFHKVESPVFAAALHVYLMHGEADLAGGMAGP